MPENTTVELIKYFGVAPSEFKVFWLSLSDEEKIYFKTADLST